MGTLKSKHCCLDTNSIKMNGRRNILHFENALHSRVLTDVTNRECGSIPTSIIPIFQIG